MTLLHRTPPGALKPGQRVTCRLLQGLICAAVSFLASGCGSSEERIAVRKASSFQLELEGPALPSPRAVTWGTPKESAERELYVIDTSGRISVYDPQHTLKRSWYMPETEVGKPEAILVTRSGRIVVADTHYSRVVFFDSSGKMTGSFGRKGRGEGEFIYPVALAEDDSGNLYVGEYGSNDRVQKFDADGNFIRAFGRFGTGESDFQRPSDIIWTRGMIYVADAINSRILVFTDSGDFRGALGVEAGGHNLHFPYDLALDTDAGGRDVLYVVEYGAGRVTSFDLEGAVLGTWGDRRDDPYALRTPWGICCDGEGSITIADTGNRRIVELELEE